MNQPLATFHMEEAQAIKKLLATVQTGHRVVNESAGAMGATTITTWATRVGLVLEVHASNGGESAFLFGAPVADDWTPTSANINALPDRVRAYIHDLVANADPSGMVAENTLLRDQTKQLDAMIGRLKRELASAPVAGESPMAKMADALREKARQEQQAYQDRRNQATEWGPMPDGTEADHPIPSAPVAHVAGDETSRYLEWAKDRSAWEMPVGTPVYYSALASAPVAGEAVNLRDAREYLDQWGCLANPNVRALLENAERAAQPTTKERT